MKQILNKKILIIVIVSILVLGASFFVLLGEYYKEKQKSENKLIVKKINSHYNKYVKTNKKTKLYKDENGKYKKVIDVEKDVEFTLKDIKINKDTKYFKVDGFNFFIKYSDVLKIDKLSDESKRYKNYIVFNENVKSKDVVRLYKDEKLVYTLYYNIDLPIIKKSDEGVYVEFNNDLYLIKKDDISSIYNKNNSSEEVAEELPVSVYHFIYLHGDDGCKEAICHSEDQIKSHFEYLTSNNYFTITTSELKFWDEDKIRLPKKSILITIDDGARAQNFIPLLEQYKVNATLFLITSWYSIDTFKSDYLEIASHSDNLHTPGVCSGGQGSPLKCAPLEELVADLKISREKAQTEAFCFPFYEYNDHGIEAIKQAGFTMGFVGGQKKFKKGGNLYTIPRISFRGDTTIDEYISAIS